MTKLCLDVVLIVLETYEIRRQVIYLSHTQSTKIKKKREQTILLSVWKENIGETQRHWSLVILKSPKDLEAYPHEEY